MALNRIGEQELSEMKMLLISPIIKNIVDSTINSTITPTGLYNVLSNGYISKRIANKSDNKGNNKSNNNELTYSIYYKNINTFILQTEPDGSEKAIVSMWKRSYLFKWKLYSLELPLD